MNVVDPNLVLARIGGSLSVIVTVVIFQKKESQKQFGCADPTAFFIEGERIECGMA
jgi:hypothetical protein